MRISAKVDYAVRALAELAAAGGGPLKGDVLADRQAIPLNFLENILGQLRRAGIVASQRGAEGGYWLARPPGAVSVAEVIRALEGPLADVRGAAPEDLDYTGPASALREVWLATRASVRAVLEEVSIGDIADGRLPESVGRLLDDPAAWRRR